MSKRLRLFLITALAAVVALCVVSGCQLSNRLEDILEDRNLNAQVTYFANGGSFSDNDRTPVKTLYYSSGTYPLDVGETTNSVMTGSMGNTQVTAGKFTIDYTGYNLKGWYLVEVNEDGVPMYEDGSLYDEAEGVVKSFKLAGEINDDNKFTFSEKLEQGDHLYLCAVWEADTKLLYKLAGEQGLTLTATVTDEDGNPKEVVYNIGDVMREEHFSSSGTISIPTSLSADDNTTFVAYYSDAECTQLFEATTVSQEDTDTILYAKFIKNHDNEREWLIVKTATDVKNMFENTSNGLNYNYYFIKDIDCTDVEITKAILTTRIAIYGNGYKIQNLTLSFYNLRNNATVSLFGNIKSDAEITKLTFENLTENVTLFPEASINSYFAFTSVEDGASISDVAISGTLNVMLNGGSIRNALNDTNTLIFGGFTSDSEYTAITADVMFNLN